jgi:hypothetical protein
MSRREALSWTLPSPAPHAAPQVAGRYPAPGAGA